MRIGLFVILAFIGVVTLLPSAQTEPQVPTLCLVCGTRGSADLMLNILMFLPLGAYIGLARVKMRWAISWCFVISAGIELTQFMVPGRNPNTGDLLANTAGGIAGYALLLLWHKQGLARTARRGPALPTLAVTLVLVASTFLLTPQYPETVYFGQWMPRVEHLDAYEGRVIEASLGDVNIENGRLARQSLIRRALALEEPLHARIIAGPPTKKLSSLVSIADNRGQEIALLGADRQDLVMRLRLHAAQWRFDQPDFRADNLLSGVTPGDTLEVAFSWADNIGCLRGQERTDCNLRHSVGIGWSLFLYPEHLPRWGRNLLSAVWLGALVLPISFTARSLTERAATCGGVACLAVAASIMPAISWPELTDWTGLAFGVVVGWYLRRLWIRRSQPSPYGTAGDS